MLRQLAVFTACQSYRFVNCSWAIIHISIGSARIADRIIVLKDGIIDDMGTHEQLISKGGLYSEMYRTQAQWYEQ